MSEDEARYDIGPRSTLAEEVDWRSVPLFAIAFALSCYASYLLLGYPAGMETFPTLGFCAHVLASALTGVGIAVALGKDETARHGWAVFLGVFAFLAGPVGVVGGIVSYLMARGQPTRSPLTEVVRAEMFVTTVTEVEPEDFATMDLKIQEEIQVEPFVDMLPVADIATAIAIVNRLRDRGQSTDIAMIYQVTNDPRPEVYQHALAVLDKMEKRFAARVFALQGEIREHPKRPSLRVEMARLHLDYMASGLLDESLRDYYWELSLAHLFEAMLAYPRQAEMGTDLAQLLALRGMFDHAGTVAGLALKKDPTILQAQLLVVRSLYERALAQESSSGLRSAKRAARETSWAVSLPKKRLAAMGPSYDLAHFWFGDRDA